MAIYNGLSGVGVEAELNRVVGPSLPGGEAVRVKKIAIVGDSFVGGAGSTAPLTFAVPLAAALRATYGDAGAGYIAAKNSKMTGYSVTANFLSQSGLGFGSAFFPWTDVHRFTAPNGMASYRDGGVGRTDGNESLNYTPNVADSFSRGVADTLSYSFVHFTLRSAKAGFAIRQSNQDLNNAIRVSSGATATGTTSGSSTTVAMTSVDGVISQSGYVTGAGVSNNVTINAGGVNSYGGAGNYAMNLAQNLAGVSLATTGNVPPLVGIPQRIGFRSSGSFLNNIQVTGVYGDVLINGVEHYNGSTGVTVTDFGTGGATAAQFAGLDDAAQRAFWQMMDFDLVIVVLGMNDRSLVNPSAHGNHMSALVSRIKASPRTRVLLVQQTDPTDGGSNFWLQYTAVLQNVAVSMGCGYYDMRTANPNLANYAAAVAAGLMEDGIHLKAAANTIVGSDMASKIKF